MGQRLRLKADFVIPQNWTIEERAVLLALKKYGAIVADKIAETGYLLTKQSYRDFVIRAEFWAETNTNSGIFIRITTSPKITATVLELLSTVAK